VILTLYEVPLPAKDQVLDLFKSLLGVHQVRTSVGLVERGSSKLIRRDFEQLEHEKFHQLVRRDFSKAVQELAESVNTDLPLFECVATSFDSKQRQTLQGDSQDTFK